MEFTKDIQFNNKPTVNQDVKITYSGFLANSSELWIVYGFGETWNNTTELKMEKNSNGFSAIINLLDFDTLNFCFKNSENQWDNNHNSNFITPILPCKKTEFDIDALIEEILQPIVFKPTAKLETVDSSHITSKSIDLGAEITKILSSIDESASQNLVEYSTLEEILCGSVIEENEIELFEQNTDDMITNELIENTTQLDTTSEFNTIEEKQSENIINLNRENSLIVLDEFFQVSPRKLSKFYLLRKRIKLAFCKVFLKLPKLIFNLDD